MWLLRPNQVHKKAIEVDAHLRVKGAPVGEVYAIGDASTVRKFMFLVKVTIVALMNVLDRDFHR